MFGFLRLFSSKPSQDRFSKMVMKKAAESGFSGEFTYNKDAFTLRHGSTRIYLGNLYVQYCQAETNEQRKQLLMNIVAPLVQQEKTISREEALERAVAVVRERALFSLGSLHWQLDGVETEKFKIALEPVSDWYCKAIVLDFPEFVRMVNEEDLKEWDISFDDLFALGLARLDACSTPKFRHENGYFVGTWKDDYDNSRILLPGLYEDLPIEGEPVFVIPNRLTLMVADSKNESALKAMLARAEEIVASEPRPHNPGPLWYHNGELRDFAVSSHSPIFNEVEQAKKLTALRYYGEQTEKLVELYQRTDKDFFVGNYQLMQRDDGSFFSWAIWSKGIQTLLPRADFVMFYDPEKPDGQKLVGESKWEHACSFAGDLMLDTEMFPPRYYVSRFPTDEQLRACLAFGIKPSGRMGL